MKLAIIVVISLVIVGFVAYMTYPWEYSEANTEAAFRKIAKDGFDTKTASQLLAQYSKAGASTSLHFLAFGFIARSENRSAFDVPLNDKWKNMVKDIDQHGEMAAEDWLGPVKYREVKDHLTQTQGINATNK